MPNNLYKLRKLAEACDIKTEKLLSLIYLAYTCPEKNGRFTVGKSCDKYLECIVSIDCKSSLFLVGFCTFKMNT